MSHPLQDLFDRVPKITCKGHCGKDKRNSCCGPIGCSKIEADILDSHLGIKMDWQDYGPGQVRVMPSLMDRIKLCPHLSRMWGTIKSMSCPWGCKA